MSIRLAWETSLIRAMRISLRNSLDRLGGHLSATWATRMAGVSLRISANRISSSQNSGSIAIEVMWPRILMERLSIICGNMRLQAMDCQPVKFIKANDLAAPYSC